MAALCILLLRTGDGFQVTMLDVGQGDCIHIRSGDGRDYLIDGGSSTKKEIMKYQMLPYLKFMGVRHLQAVFVTHADKDHCSGIIELLEEYPVRGLTIGSLVLPAIDRESAYEQRRDAQWLTPGFVSVGARMGDVAKFYEIQQKEFIQSGEVDIPVPVGRYVLLDNMKQAAH